MGGGGALLRLSDDNVSGWAGDGGLSVERDERGRGEEGEAADSRRP